MESCFRLVRPDQHGIASRFVAEVFSRGVGGEQVSASDIPYRKLQCRLIRHEKTQNTIDRFRT